MRILLVEDETRIASFLIRGLTAEGYDVEVVGTGQGALERAARRDLDLLILDLGLPDMDGSEVLRRIRSIEPNLPVIVVTARSDVSDRVAGLELGADDYLTKPFVFAELLARIRARLRNHRSDQAAILRSRVIRLDLRTRRATVDSRSVELSTRESALLEVLLRNRGRVLSRDQLLSRVWGLHHDPGSNIVDVYIRYLRRKLAVDFIETVRGAGYCLVDEEA